MGNYPVAKLKAGKDVPLRAGHPWIFSHALERDADTAPGEIVEVLSSDGKSLGLGYRNPLTSIRVRMLTADSNEKVDAGFFARRLKRLDEWKSANLPAKTDGYRVAHAEVDGLPGLIVDRYADVVVFQIHTAGMDLLRDQIVEGIKAALKPKAVVERSDVEARNIEGLRDRPAGVLFGKVEKPVTFKEAGVKFYADVLRGQKTGFFLDQRGARLAVGQLADGKRVLNLFGYTGAFSVHAALGGASFVSTVDISNAALETAMENFKLNKLDPEDESRFEFLEADVLDYLADIGNNQSHNDQLPKKSARNSKFEIPNSRFDLIVCDPPAFAKSEKHLPQALKAYTDVNAACLRLLEKGGILVTSSCSGRLDPEGFRNMLRIAAGRAGKQVRVRQWIGHEIDHAERLAFPEGRYLKTAVLEVE